MDTDLSLDDIITKTKSTLPKGKRGRGGGRGGRGGVAKIGVKPIINRANNNAQRGIQGRRGGRGGVGRANATIGDARSRIIQHKRQKITDAREKLGEIAKMSDARLKLNKIHGVKPIGSRNAGPQMLTVKGGIVVHTGRNGQIELSTKKKIKAIPPLINPFSLPTRTADYRDTLLPSLMDLETELEDTMNLEPLLIRRTVENRSALPALPSFPPPRDAFSWKKPAYMDDEDEGYDRIAESMLRSKILREPRLSPQRPLTKTIRLQPRMAPVNVKKSQDWFQHDLEPPSPKRVAPVQRPRTVQTRPQVVYDDDDDDDDDDEAVVSYPRGSFAAAREAGGVKARLAAVKPASRSMGILSNESRSAPARTTVIRAQNPPAENHRIVVSNLQKSVTNEDIRELFEDVGSLVTSKLVRPGTAEVVYRSRKDAMKAVDIYHNRQLDGEPMKCMLVNHRPPQVSAQPTPTRTASAAHFRGAVSSRFPTTKSQKPAVYPDVDTIHKVLFNKRS